jgi:hypothetical protein
MFTAKYQTKCKACGLTIHPGTLASKKAGVGTVHHACYLKGLSGQGQGLSTPASLKPTPKAQPFPSSYYTSDYVPALASQPLTQKGKGIKILQSANLLGKDMAIVATDVEQAVKAFQTLQPKGDVFMRPCPIYARHGFVDSRKVKDVTEVRSVWAEARAVDPQAEAILMPFIPAQHSMVWRPGQLSIGPGHDGATAGHDSVAVFLQPAYPASWKGLATKAGVRLEAGADPIKEPAQSPFIEAVATSTGCILTQIRAGGADIITEPDWNPAPFTVGEVITIDHAKKEDPGAMVEWETTAKGLKPGFHVVYNPGGNMGDHWSVHAQLAKVAIVTTFQPVVGQVLPKLGIDLVPMDPQAVLYGFLGGLLGPSLLPKVNRERAVAAAILGTHHGLMNGGDAGVFVGASCAFLLRLAQAALWGEARHNPADVNHHKGLSRQQIFSQVLDNWTLGRSRLADVVIGFHSWGQGTGFGGDAWAAVGRGTIDLDSAMLRLVNEPTVANAENVVAVLTNVVNLAHNNGWFLNKFASSSLFDQAEAYDPQVAVMAGPVWYDSVLQPCDTRVVLLGELQTMQPLTIGKHAAKVLKIKTVKGKGTKAAQAGTTVGSILGLGQPEMVYKPSLKAGGFNATVPDTYTIVSAQAKESPISEGVYQTQVVIDAEGHYISGGLVLGTVDLSGLPDVLSLSSGSSAMYKLLPVVDGKIVIEGGK